MLCGSIVHHILVEAMPVALLDALIIINGFSMSATILCHHDLRYQLEAESILGCLALLN